MRRNVGRAERGIRLMVGLIVAFAGFAYGSYWGLLGLVPLLTGGLAWCPMYAALGINSCRSERAMS